MNRGRTKRSPIINHHLLDYLSHGVSDSVDVKDPHNESDPVNFDTNDVKDVSELYHLRDPNNIRDPTDVNALDLIRAHVEDFHNLLEYIHDLRHAHAKERHELHKAQIKEKLDILKTRRKDKMPVPLSAFEGSMCPTGWARFFGDDSCIELD